jgi:two-component system response regulator NreC
VSGHCPGKVLFEWGGTRSTGGGVKIVLADELRMVREGFRAVLESAGLQVIGEAANGHEAIAQAKRLRPDVVVIGITMPELNGIDATRRLVAEVPGTKVLALSRHADRRYVIGMLEAGAAGYLLKTSAVEDLLTALTVVARGEMYLSPTIARDVVDEAIRGGSPSGRTPQKSLSSREREVLQLVAEDKSSKQIATLLQIAVPTVEAHRHQVMEKLNLRTIAELTKYAIREGLTSSER